MLDDLDSSLAALLDDLTAPQDLRDADVVFRTPDRTFAPGRPTVSLFAHGVQENRDLRDTEPIRELVGGVLVEQRPPLRADCSYLVTTWSELVGEAKVQAEHRLLSLALLWLARYPEIPAASRRGTLVAATHPPPTLVAQAEGPSNGAEFWTALGIAPRPSFRLVVTIELHLDDQVDLGPPVTTSEIRIRESGGPTESGFSIGGVVTTLITGLPVAGATVAVVGHPSRATTDADGRFVLVGIPDGAWMLETRHPDFTTASTSIDVPEPTPDGYDHTLAP